MRPRIGVVTFPGSNDDRDALRAVRLMGGEPVPVWHADPDLHGTDGVILPGGFSYGDYLRTGAIARFAPVLAAVREHAAAGGPVLGICNGFQILCEAGLLPGALIRHRGLAFVCRWVNVRIEGSPSGEVLSDPHQARRGPVRGRGRRAGPHRARRAWWPSATAPRTARSTRPTTPTAPPTRSPACGTRRGTCSASCRTPSTPSTPTSAPPGASTCSTGFWRRPPHAGRRVARPARA